MMELTHDPRDMNPRSEPPDEQDAASSDPGGTGERRVPVMQEEWQVAIVREHTGTVRIRKVTHESSAPHRTSGYREEVAIERRPVDETVAQTRAPWHDGEALVIPVYEERLVRQVVLVEELRVSRKRVPTDSTMTLVTRREEIVIERLDPVSGEWSPIAPEERDETSRRESS